MKHECVNCLCHLNSRYIFFFYKFPSSVTGQGMQKNISLVSLLLVPKSKWSANEKPIVS